MKPCLSRWYAVLGVALLASCSGDSMVQSANQADVPAQSVTVPGPPVPLTPLVQLDIPTYERSGQAVHPDVVRFRQPWHGWEYWMAMTPFPLGREAFENPSILVSHDGLTWQLPDGLTNPLARTPDKMGYNSDPDMVYDAASDQLVMLYREVSATQNLIHSITSADGVHWSAPTLLFARPNHNIVSPTTTIGPSGQVLLWYVNAGPKNCSERLTHVSLQTAATAAALSAGGPSWTAPKHHVLVQAGMNIWHIDATWIAERGEYWAAYIAYPIHHCAGQDLFFARSSDGVNWTTYPIPFLRRDAATWTAMTLYRASIGYDPARDAIQFFVSGQANDKRWHLGYVDYRRADFLASLEGAAEVPAARVADVMPVAEP